MAARGPRSARLTKLLHLPSYCSHERQLTLITEERQSDWRLDEHTKEVGRKGLADARQALADARKRVAA